MKKLLILLSLLSLASCAPPKEPFQTMCYHPGFSQSPFTLEPGDYFIGPTLVLKRDGYDIRLLGALCISTRKSAK